MTALMDLVVACENVLGWQPNPRQPLWQARGAEIAKLQRAIDRGIPNRDTTLANLRLALEYSRLKRLPVTSPSALPHRIRQALERAYIPPAVCDLDQHVAEAVQWERERDDPDSLRWIYRLTRSVGSARAEVLLEWQGAGRG